MKIQLRGQLLLIFPTTPITKILTIKIIIKICQKPNFKITNPPPQEPHPLVKNLQKTLKTKSPTPPPPQKSPKRKTEAADLRCHYWIKVSIG